MNLSKLFDIQNSLDAPYSQVEDRLSKDILWLMEELGELAREWRGHKYRRPGHEQKPRTIEWVNTDNPDHACAYNPLLEEYTDCLSIILSIGLQIGFLHTGIEWETEAGDPIHDFIDIIDWLGDLTNSTRKHAVCPNDAIQDFCDMTKFFLDLGMSLGFTWEQIEANYIVKAEANAKRNTLAVGHQID